MGEVKCDECGTRDIIYILETSLDAIVDIRLAIRNAETRMWKALKSEPSFDISMEETHKVLQKFSRSKVTLAILHVDLVGSTHLSMTLPLDRLNNYSSNIYSGNVYYDISV